MQTAVARARRATLAQLNSAHSCRRMLVNSSTLPETTNKTLRGMSDFDTNHAAHAPEPEAKATTNFIGA